MVVATQRVDQDDVETALLRNQPLQGRPLVQSQRLGREIRRLGADVGLQRIGILLASPLPQLVEADLHVGAAEQWLAGGIGGAEVEVYAGGETEYAVVVGQASDEMVVAQQSWLVDEIHRDDIVTLGACHIPHATGLFRELLPRIAVESAVEGLERAAIGAEHLVLAAIAEHEAEPGAAEQTVGVAAAQHAVQARVFQNARRLRRVAVEAAIAVQIAVVIENRAIGIGRIDEHAVLRVTGGLRILRPGVEIIDAGTTEDVVVAAAAVDLVVVVRRCAFFAGGGIAPQPVVTGETVNRIAAAAAVDAVAPSGSHQQIVAGTAVDHADEIIAARVEIADVERQHGPRRRRSGIGGIGIGDELDIVIAQQAGHPELLHQRFAVRIQGFRRVEIRIAVLIDCVGAPRSEDFPRFVGAGDRIDRAEIHVHAAVRELADQNGVRLVGALDQHDVGGIVVSDVTLMLVAVLTVERVLRRDQMIDRRQRIRLAHALGRKVLAPRVEHHDVDAGAAVERVVSALAFQPIRIPATPQHVVATTAQQLILSGSTIENVAATDRVGELVTHQRRASEVIAGDIFVAAVAEDHIAAQVSVHPVIAGAAVHFVAPELGLGRNLRIGGRHAHIGERVHEVDTVATPQPLPALFPHPGRGIEAAGIAEQEIAPLVAVDLVDPFIAHQAGNNRSVADLAVRAAGGVHVIAVHHVVVGAAADHVIAAFAIHLVAFHAAIEVIGASATLQQIASAAAEDDVRAIAAGDHVVELFDRDVEIGDHIAEFGECAQRGAAARSCALINRCRVVIALAANRKSMRDDRSDARWRVSGGGLRLRRVKAGRIFKVGWIRAGEETRRKVIEPAPDQIIARATGNRVVAATADDDIVACVTPDAVVASDGDHAGRIAINDVVARTAMNGVIALIAVDRVVAYATRNIVVALIALDVIVAARGDNDVVPGTPENLAVAAAQRDAVVAGLAVDLLVAVAPYDDVVAALAVDLVAVVQSGDVVVALGPRVVARLVVAVDEVVASAAVDRVVAAAAVDLVGVAVAEDRVVALVAVDLVHPGAAVDRVGALVAVDEVLALVAEDRVVAEAA